MSGSGVGSAANADQPFRNEIIKHATSDNNTTPSRTSPEPDNFKRPSKAPEIILKHRPYF